MYWNFNKYFDNLFSVLSYLKRSSSLQRYLKITKKISENGKEYIDNCIEIYFKISIYIYICFSRKDIIRYLFRYRKICKDLCLISIILFWYLSVFICFIFSYGWVILNISDVFLIFQRQFRYLFVFSNTFHFSNKWRPRLCRDSIFYAHTENSRR